MSKVENIETSTPIQARVDVDKETWKEFRAMMLRREKYIKDFFGEVVREELGK